MTGKELAEIFGTTNGRIEWAAPGGHEGPVYDLGKAVLNETTLGSTIYASGQQEWCLYESTSEGEVKRLLIAVVNYNEFIMKGDLYESDIYYALPGHLGEAKRIVEEYNIRGANDRNGILH